MSENAPSGKLWLWGTIMTLVLFSAFFIGFAIWTFQTDVELVYDNYYEKDVVFEEQIRRVERTEALPVKPELKYERSRESLMIHFPTQMNHLEPTGSILLFRPSDLNLDRLFTLNLSGDTLQTISLPELLPGLWRIKLNWTSSSVEYYLEEMLVVN